MQRVPTVTAISEGTALSLMRPIRLEASLRMLSVGAISPNA